MDRRPVSRRTTRRRSTPTHRRASLSSAGTLPAHPSLGSYVGRYLFGRFGGAQLFVMNAGGGPVQGTGLNIPSLSSFGEDGVGQLYVTSLAGAVSRLSATGSTLSATSVGTFNQPSAVAAPYGDPDRLFIAELGGRIVLRTAGQNHEFSNLDPIVLTGGEQGLLSVAVAPDYAVSGRVFVFYNDNAGNLALDVLRRSGSDPNTADPSTRRNVLTIAHSQADNHNGGQLQFGSDGYLYLSTGDGARRATPRATPRASARCSGRSSGSTSTRRPGHLRRWRSPVTPMPLGCGRASSAASASSSCAAPSPARAATSAARSRRPPCSGSGSERTG